MSESLRYILFIAISVSTFIVLKYFLNTFIKRIALSKNERILSDLLDRYYKGEDCKEEINIQKDIMEKEKLRRIRKTKIYKLNSK